ncbi:Uncharacterised protein [Bordetella pertussis]|nr:Uncharacterised protein [Bordetella pertussis]
MASSSRCLPSTGSRASMTYRPASHSSSLRSTRASCSKRRCASGDSRKRRTRAGPSSRSPGACRRSRYSSKAMLSSMPGVSNHSIAAALSMARRAPSTWRVVPG